MERIALILEVSGFFIASVSFALLKIGAIRDWSDRMKSSTLIVASKYTKSFSTPQLLSVMFFLEYSVKKLIISPLGILTALFETFVELCQILFNWKIPERREIRVKIFKNDIEILKNLSKLYMTDWIALPLILLLTISNGIHITSKLTVRILSGKETVTNFFIVIGTLAIFAGLILELVSKF